MISFALALLLPVGAPKRLERLPLSGSGLSGDGRTVVGFIEERRRGKRQHAPCLWTRSGGLQRLDLGRYREGHAHRASADGKAIVGLVERGDREFVALWRTGKRLRVLAPYGSPRPFGYYPPDVSGDGRWVVGTSAGRPFKWSERTGLRFLAPRERKHPKGFVNAVSFDGSVIVGGTSAGPNPEAVRRARLFPSSLDARGTESFRACVWRSNDPPQELPMPRDAKWAEAVGVSADGTLVVGEASSFAGNSTFVWSMARGYRRLPDVSEETGTAWVRGISPDGGTIFGTSDIISCGRFFGTIWRRGQPTMIDDYLRSLGVLGLEGWKTYYVEDVSEGGRVILGEGWGPGDVHGSWLVELGPPWWKQSD